MTNSAISKRRIIDYTKKEGNPVLGYWLESAEGALTKCSPQVWHRIAVPDITDEATSHQAAKARFEAERAKRSFGWVIDATRGHRAGDGSINYAAALAAAGLKF